VFRVSNIYHFCASGKYSITDHNPGDFKMAKTNEELSAELDALVASNNELMTVLYRQLSEQQVQIDGISSLLATTITELKNRNVIQP
jgi:hypothetical protein